MIFVALGLMTGVFMPWVDPERLGPTSFIGYGYAFVFFVLPGLFFVSALLFLLATLTRSMLGTYIGIIAFFVLWQIALVTAGNLEHRTLGALIDPFGFGAFELATRYWSAQDRNTARAGDYRHLADQPRDLGRGGIRVDRRDIQPVPSRPRGNALAPPQEDPPRKSMKRRMRGRRLFCRR